MSILLLIAAVVCWLIAAVPGFIHVAIGWLDFGWVGEGGRALMARLPGRA